MVTKNIFANKIRMRRTKEIIVLLLIAFTLAFTSTACVSGRGCMATKIGNHRR